MSSIPATEVHEFQVTVEPGTPQDNPLVQQLVLPYRNIVSIEFEVPPGPLGTVGFQLWHSGTQLLPYEAGAWFIWDGVTKEWDFEDLLESPGWQLAAYNNGNYPHTIYVRMRTVPLSSAQPATVVPQANISITTTPASSPTLVQLQDLVPIT